MHADDTVRIPLHARDGSIRDYALVDRDDYPIVAGYTWSMSVAKGRRSAVGSVNGKVTPMHRVIMNAPKGMLVDHRNHDTLDNRRANLRIVTPAQNTQNRRGAASHSGTGVRNVQVYGNRYQVYVTVEGQRIYAGVFDTLGEAAEAAKAARQRWMPYSET